MRDQNRKNMMPLRHVSRLRYAALTCGLFIVFLYFGACDSGAPSLPGSVDSAKSSRASDRSLVRAARRAYDGAPPIIPHMQMGASCTSCHSQTGIQFGDMGFAPPMPHTTKSNAGMFARCEQCHVYAEEKALFVKSDFLPMRQDLRKGKRATSISPPTMPHQVFMRENCAACHTGPAAREEILCPHPERVRCAQCHVPVTESGEFTRTEPTS